ncbi:MAG: long-chain-acyl-CoA synthetase, partial [Gammaproteobacteria bacterium]|nr:long-chain-acyl-CoA synthetase [Gammaproteobacteria bacterium]
MAFRFLDRLKGDAVVLREAARALRMVTPIAKNPDRVFPDIVEELAQEFGDAPALIGKTEQLSYRALDERSNRYARWALRQDVSVGDAVCLLMPNRPEFMAVWIGITRAGGVVALLNTNLVGPSLAHCIDIVAPKHIIVAAGLLAAFKTAEPLLASTPKVWVHGETGDEFPRIDREIDQLPGDALAPTDRRPLTIEDRALYLYTSGTSGLPKAANVNHYRVLSIILGAAALMNTQRSDRMYDCLPMYHVAGGLSAAGAVLINGGAVIIRERFSASEFWEDIVRFDCTLFQYIGELCRYLVNSPPHPRETGHRLRLAFGNGLRSDVWEDLQSRFRIPRILEFYTATEGNVSLINFEGKPGAVGRIPWFLSHRFPTTIVRFEIETEQVFRNDEGFCVPCATNETGEAIGKIVNDACRPTSRFEGYANKADDEKKILRDVFEKGDRWFRTGDLMRKDENGHFYFVDRVGDTFRWKGENVSTAEVAVAMTAFPGILEANVYGVQVPGSDGRAGMAAIVCDGPIELGDLHEHLVKQLPEYARPLFLRVGDEFEVTATFKQKKADLVRQ